MELTEKEVAEINGGNWFFASVADSLRQDIMEEGQMFYKQGAIASWEEGVSPFTGEREVALRIEGEEPNGDYIGIFPMLAGGEFGLQVLAGRQGSVYAVSLFKDSASAFTALEVSRLACVAKFGLENRRAY